MAYEEDQGGKHRGDNDVQLRTPGSRQPASDKPSLFAAYQIWTLEDMIRVLFSCRRVPRSPAAHLISHGAVLDTKWQRKESLRQILESLLLDPGLSSPAQRCTYAWLTASV